MRLARLILVAALLLVAPGLGGAQTPETAKEFLAALEPTLQAARLVIDAPESSAQDLENMREKLLVLRGQSGQVLATANDALAEAKSRLDPLGPPPADGATEPAEVSARRNQVNKDIADRQIPVIEIQDATRQINEAVSQIDREVWSRVRAEMTTLGPSPILPENWTATAGLVRQRMIEGYHSTLKTYADAEYRKELAARVPASVALFAIGITIAILLRRWVIPWVEAALGAATTPRAIAWLVALRNVTRLLLPVLGASLVFTALDPVLLMDGLEPFRILGLPPFILALIAAQWLGSSLFAPRLPQYRLVSVNDADAVKGTAIVYLLGGVLSAHLFIINHLDGWEMSPAMNATLQFPFTLLGSYGLWQASRLWRRVLRNIAKNRASLPPEQHVGAFGVGLMVFLERAVAVVAVLAPVLAAIGYYAASRGLLYPMILTLALFGANLIFFDLLNKTLQSIGRRSGAQTGNEGLGPVVVAAILGLASLAPLALIWGARPSDLASSWLLVSEGGSLGGIRISAADVLTLVFVFGVGYALTRTLQSVLRNTVLPRTRMDAGGKNAVLAGIGYVGTAIATLAAISATGIDLSNIAIVAGALSVGIGFGLQNIVSNFVSGIILLVERPIKQGDWIEVGGFTGYVRRISVRSTEIETFDRASVILPNSDLIAGTVLNRTHSGMTGRISIPVSVTYDSDPRKVADILLDIAESHPLVLEEPAPRVLLMALSPDSVDFEVRCVLRDVNFSLSVRSDMNFEIVERLRAGGIRTQFWQRDTRAAPVGAAGAADEFEPRSAAEGDPAAAPNQTPNQTPSQTRTEAEVAKRS